MFSIEGNHIGGIGFASRIFHVQIPVISSDFPEISRCFPGTINVKLDSPLIIISPDHRSKPIKWGSGKAEVFEFLRVGLEMPIGSPVVPAWLYIATDSPHRSDLSYHEVIATSKLNFTERARCKLYINKTVIKPYMNHDMFWVI